MLTFGLGAVSGVFGLLLLQSAPKSLVNGLASALLLVYHLGWEAHLSFLLVIVLAMRARTAAGAAHAKATRDRLYALLRSPFIAAAIPLTLVAVSLAVVAVALTTAADSPCDASALMQLPRRGAQGILQRLARPLSWRSRGGLRDQRGGGSRSSGNLNSSADAAEMLRQAGTFTQPALELCSRAFVRMRPALLALLVQYLLPVLLNPTVIGSLLFLTFSALATLSRLFLLFRRETTQTTLVSSGDSPPQPSARPIDTERLLADQAVGALKSLGLASAGPAIRRSSSSPACGSCASPAYRAAAAHEAELSSPAYRAAAATLAELRSPPALRTPVAHKGQAGGGLGASYVRPAYSHTMAPSTWHRGGVCAAQVAQALLLSKVMWDLLSELTNCRPGASTFSCEVCDVQSGWRCCGAGGSAVDCSDDGTGHPPPSWPPLWGPCAAVAGGIGALWAYLVVLRLGSTVLRCCSTREAALTFQLPPSRHSPLVLARWLAVNPPT